MVTDASVDGGTKEKLQTHPHEKMMNEFDSVRLKLSSEVKIVSSSFKNTKELLQAETKLYHVRQDLVDYKYDLSKALGVLNKQLKQLKQQRMMAHKENKIATLPSSAAEKKIMDDSYFASTTEIIERFDSQFTWCKDSIASCDEMSNGLSYYIKLANLLGGAS